MRKHLPVAALALAVTFFALIGSVAASTGSIGGATTNPEWSKASFSVSLEGTPCGPSGSACSWLPVVTTMPSLPEYRCTGEEFFDNDRNTETIWRGATHSQNGPESTAVSEAELLRAVYGQRLCLSLVGTREVVDVLCERDREIFEREDGKVRPHCPLRKEAFGEFVATTIPTVVTPTAPSPPGAPIAPVPPATSPACVKGAGAVAKERHRVTIARARYKKAPAKSRSSRLLHQVLHQRILQQRQTEKQVRELCS